MKPEVEAAIVKDLGVNFEQDLGETLRRLLPEMADTSAQADPISLALAQAVLEAPSFSLRGGTREILRGIIARGLGLR
jgi:hypothetical protein